MPNQSKSKSKGKKNSNSNNNVETASVSTKEKSIPNPIPVAVPEKTEQQLTEEIHEILRQPDLLEHSFQETLEEFLKMYTYLAIRLKACYTMVSILNDPNCSLNDKQKTIAYALLIGAYGKGPLAYRANPFEPFIHLIFNKDPQKFVSKILFRLIVNDPKSRIWDDKAAEVIDAFESLQYEISTNFPGLSELIQSTEEDLRVLLSEEAENRKNFSSRFNENVSHAQNSNWEKFDEEDRQKFKELTSLLHKANEKESFRSFSLPDSCPNCSDFSHLGSLKPKTVPPPLYDGEANHELCWITPLDSSTYELILDPSGSLNIKREKAASEQLIQQAFNEALSLNQRQVVMNELKAKPSIVNSLGVTADTLPRLVENNPIVAIDVLLKLMDSGEDMKPYLAALIHMEMSVHSMDVVNRLATSVGLPKEFLYLYISNCIKTCEGIQDKYIQNRLVRLLCVFLQSSIRNQIINFQDVYIEILTFCVEFSRMREAAALFRLMKQVESEDPELQQVLHKKLESHQLLSEAAEKFSSRDKDAK